jgi:hypothetical protein
MNNIKRDEQRVFNYYTEYSFGYDIQKEFKEFLEGPFDITEGNSSFCISPKFFDSLTGYLKGIPDLSEEFHRKYYKRYDLQSWDYVFLYQTKLSEQFYDDFFHMMTKFCLSVIIKNNRVSSKWVEKNLHRIPQEVWKGVYK